ncbi:TTL domain-containing protein [Colletotrichum orchidophilum]|uniref:TTL domain-containing protein n=1 Tax=Colletotrichum orchidophilum TaxID=1209926 RepID=A0A1G4BQG0_9PEZI|nr:TTL domain-containing protein [Colletotrichum orchidophilum]OHF03565.1 TTL domain-containing protein [Colletotrichum orchidophilum]
MRLLVVNDDGPPSSVSPYLAPLISALNEAGHTTVVVIPDKPLSWIGKAHAVGKTLTAASRCPLSFFSDGKTTCNVAGCEETEDRTHRWLVVDGLPASCTQIGLFHTPGLKPEDFDLVLSGPNHGRNASTVYALSSGTVGGAMEAAQCGRRAVALSFGSKEAQPAKIIRAACERAVALVEDLARTWHRDVEVYSVNVPMVADIADRPVRMTTTAHGRWITGGLFSPVVDADPEKLAASRTYQFRWAPQLADIKRQAEESPEGEDLWASLNGVISIAPLRASFTAVSVQE